MRFKKWYETHSKEEKDFFLLHFRSAICFLAIFLVAAFIGDEHPKYYKAQNALFIGLTMFLLLILIRRNGLVQIVRNTFDLRKKEIKLNDISDIIFTLMIILSLVSFIFILDLKFISNIGIKIGGVIAVSFVSLFSSLRKTFKKN